MKRLSINFISLGLLLVSVLAVFLQFSPHMPTMGLDPSWQFGMNYAISHGLSFGHDVVFTFGPFAPVYTGQYHPETYSLMQWGGLYLALAFWLGIAVFLNEISLTWVVVFCFILLGMMIERDSLLLSLPLIIGLAVFKINDDEQKCNNYYLMVGLLIYMFSALGLLTLVKGSMLIFSIAIIAISSLLFASNRKHLFAIICMVSPLVSILVFWVISGQTISNLPSYFTNIFPIISGYTEAMSSNGPLVEIIIYIIPGLLLLLSILLQKILENKNKLFLITVFSLFLFLGFKAGFVRHDGHALLPASAILIATMLLILTEHKVQGRLIGSCVLLAVLCWGVIDAHYVKTSTQSVTDRIISKYSIFWYGLIKKGENIAHLDIQFKQAVDTIKKQMNFPEMDGSTDIYSYNQSALIASDILWSPRPILQSYSVYTPALAELNRKHLIGDSAPENIIFSVETIDSRIPSLDDGASWPELITNYKWIEIRDNFLFLQKREKFNNAQKLNSLISIKSTFGQKIVLPVSSKPIFMQVDIKKTFLGHILSILYKPEQLYIRVELQNGKESKYRLIANMARSGFIISPLIENTTEFSMLFGEKFLLNNKQVKAITISPVSGKNSWQWKSEYSIEFSELIGPNSVEPSERYNISRFSKGLTDKDLQSTGNCTGSLDIINGRLASEAGEHFASGLLNVNGWMAISIEEGVLPDSVYIVLTNKEQGSQYVKSLSSPRPDVGAYFKKTEMNGSGYKVMADVSTLNGLFELEIAIERDGKVMLCPQFKIPLRIKSL